MKKYKSSIIVGILFFIIWEVVARWIDAAYILPSPSKILEKIWDLRDILFLVHLPATLLVTFIGLADINIFGCSFGCNYEYK